MAINKKALFGFNQWGKRENRENIYYGCFNNCFYCGVRRTQCLWLKKRPFNQWHLMEFKKEQYNQDIFKRNDVSICFTGHDIFPFNQRLCFKFLKRLINPHKDIYNRVLIVTKPRFSVIKDLLRYLSNYQLLQYAEIRFTITTKRTDLLKFWEENASLYDERKKCLEYIYSFDYPYEVKNSWVIEPILDDPDDLLNLIDENKDLIRGDIWLGLMNRISSRKALIERGYSKIYITHHNRIRNIYSKENLEFLLRNLENNKKIKYKESLLKKDLLSLIPKSQIVYT